MTHEFKPRDPAFRLTDEHARARWRPTAFLARWLAIAAGAIVLVVAFLFSIFLFALAGAAALVFLGYLWWRTRSLRRTQATVIEGEAIRITRSPDPDGG